jgi:asparagine synthase (glutamine-hydrolysing)
VRRSLVGAFDPRCKGGFADPSTAFDPEPAESVGQGPLRLAWTGPTAPMAGGTLCLLDGNLTNAAELAAELDDPLAGSAEELLAAAYRRWGRGLPERMRGDFVLLAWDRERGEGLIARDQLGLRPFFLCDRGAALLFAAEIKHLLALLPQRPAPDSACVAHWLAASGRPGMHTLYRGVRRLPPGGILLLDGEGVREERYWRPRFREPLAMSSEQLIASLRGELERAVARQTGAAGRTGVLMSGGLDSSSLAALAMAGGQGRIGAYSGTFPDHPAVDESELIGELRRALGLPGTTAEVRPGGLLASAIEHLAAFQLPLLGWGDFWMLPLVRAAREDGVERMLDGTGGDELFGPFSYLLADRLRAGHPIEALSLAYELPGGGRHVPRREVAAVIRSLALGGALPYRLHDAFRGRLGSSAPRWLLPRTARELARSDDSLAWKRLDGPRWWAYTADGIARGVEASGVLENQSRWAATAGVEVRLPFLDLDLVELGLRQPPRATFDRRFSRPLLRASLAGLLPDSVRLRPGKAWFDSLIVDCLADADGDAVRSLLGDPGAELGAYVDLPAMRAALLDTDRLRRSDPLGWMSRVWRLVTAELWLRTQGGGGSSAGLGERPSAARVEIRVDRPYYLFTS